MGEQVALAAGEALATAEEAVEKTAELAAEIEGKVEEKVDEIGLRAEIDRLREELVKCLEFSSNLESRLVSLEAAQERVVSVVAPPVEPPQSSLLHRIFLTPR